MNNTYCIPIECKEILEKKIASLQKKAEKCGKAFNVEFGDSYAKERAIISVDEFGVWHKEGTSLVEVFDLTIKNDEIIKNNGYQVVAKIEHLEGGNIVRRVTEDDNPEWYHVGGYCEHCGTKHSRKFTFVVKHENGTFKQVGLSCLKMYTGIDPQIIGICNELKDLIIDMDFDGWDFEKRPVETVYDFKKALAMAVKIIKSQGYVKTSMLGSNKEILSEMMLGHMSVNKEDEKKAEEIIEMLESISEEDTGKYGLYNIKAIAHSGYCKASHFGFIAYAPILIEDTIKAIEEKKKREQEKNAEKAMSNYVGEVGEKIKVNISDAKLVTKWENQFGYTYLYKFVDNDGNVFVWFASKCADIENAETVTGTVKDHSEREGIKQTVITRCKIA